MGDAKLKAKNYFWTK